MSLATIQAITFDAAQTLFHPRPSVGDIYAEIMAQHGLSYPADELQAGFLRGFRSARKDRSIADGELRERRYWETVVQESIRGFDAQPCDFDALFHDLWHAFARGDRWQVDPQAPEVLAVLRERGYSVHLLTNWDQRVRQVVAESSLARSFDHLFISSEIGAEKPEPAIFAHVESTLGLGPEQLLHVGDSPTHDMDGALAAGWAAFLLDPAASPEQPHFALENLDSLLAALPESVP